MNIFEGFRRVAKIFAALIIVGAIIGLLVEKPNVVLKYRVIATGLVLDDADDSCRIGVDGIDSDVQVTASGREYRRSFCFVATKSDEGALLVPYKVEGGSILLHEPYSAEVKEHMTNFMASRAPSQKELDDADAEYKKRALAKWGYGIALTVTGLLIFWAFVWVVGWIARGFMGIPRGQDKK